MLSSMELPGSFLSRGMILDFFLVFKKPEYLRTFLMGVQNTSEFEIKVDGRPINNYASCRCLTGLHAGGCCCSSAGGLGVWQYQLWSFNLWDVDFLLKKRTDSKEKKIVM